jgi:HEAT repeat protein
MDNEIEQLIADLNCDEYIKCQKARRRLVEMGSVVVPRLVQELSSSKYQVRWEVTKALGQIADKSAAEALVKALEDAEFDVRWLAAEALIKVKRDALEPLLTALADHGDKSISLRHGAHHVLHDMELGNLRSLLLPVMKAVEDSEPYSEILVVAKRTLEVLRHGNI